MRFINVYFIGYIVLMIGIAMGLWKSGVLNHVQPIWIVIGVIVAIGLGIMAAVGAGKPTITRE